MALNNLEDRLECAIRHINTALDIDPWAQNLAVESMRMRIAMMKGSERKTGKWIKITTGAMREKYMCSVCGRTIEEDGIESLIPIKYPFCHCGAKMEEEETEVKI